MAEPRIPSDLARMVSERRLIPFVGAGFSAALDLPGWDELLSAAAAEIEGIPDYASIREACGGDPLQIAEYLYLKSDETIGPLRHKIALRLSSEQSVLVSTAHVELANLGCPQIYTTNFDDLLERAYRELGLPVQVVALPKHVAGAENGKTQVVKFHGDLQHENTLVLTESQYYRRLEFESPMDLKFRSDLLGKSVLFMGYSFRDINIRVIWFKLMEIMRQIPQPDRPPSYIVRTGPSPVLETLYESVGLKTIVLDPSDEASSPREQTELLARFLTDLSIAASPDGRIPGLGSPMFASRGLVEDTRDSLRLPFPAAPPDLGSGRNANTLLQHLSRRRIHADFNSQAIALVRDAVANPITTGGGVALAITLARQFGPSTDITFAVASGLMSGFSRRPLLEAEPEIWPILWGAKLNQEDAARLIRRLRTEINFHSHEADYDLAYAVDIVGRIASGEILQDDLHDVQKEAAEALNEATELYASVSGYAPTPGEAPNPDEILSDIQDRLQSEDAEDEPDWD